MDGGHLDIRAADRAVAGVSTLVAVVSTLVAGVSTLVAGVSTLVAVDGPAQPAFYGSQCRQSDHGLHPREPVRFRRSFVVGPSQSIAVVPQRHGSRCRPDIDDLAGGNPMHVQRQPEHANADGRGAVATDFAGSVRGVSVGCPWTAQGSAQPVVTTAGTAIAPAWFTVAPSAGSGPQALSVNVLANTSTSQRVGSIAVGNITIAIAQSGQAEVATPPATPPDPCSSFQLQRAGIRCRRMTSRGTPPLPSSPATVAYGRQSPPCRGWS